MTKDRSNVVPIKRRPGVSEVFGVQLDAPETDGQRKPGRPLGSKTQEIPYVEAGVTRCRCGSTERSEYTNRREHAHAGIATDGKPYTHTVWRDTKCLNCGQRRCDIARENRVQPIGETSGPLYACSPSSSSLSSPSPPSKSSSSRLC